MECLTVGGHFVAREHTCVIDVEAFFSCFGNAAREIGDQHGTTAVGVQLARSCFELNSVTHTNLISVTTVSSIHRLLDSRPQNPTLPPISAGLRSHTEGHRRRLPQ